MESLITVLYVDDESINLMLFSQMFKTKFTVQTAISGFEGLEILQKDSDIRVVISDMNMPDMNGIKFIQKARKLYPDILFYILTGYEITQEIQDSLDNGLITNYFQKPYNMKEIYESITNDLVPGISLG